MKLSVIGLLVVTSLVLLTTSILASLNFPFSWIFYLTVLGQGLLIYSVIRILKDKYTTDKSFEDFYEDYPISKDEFNF